MPTVQELEFPDAIIEEIGEEKLKKELGKDLYMLVSNQKIDSDDEPVSNTVNKITVNGKTVYVLEGENNARRIVAKKYDKETIDLMAEVAEKLEWQEVHFVPEGRPGAIPENLRVYAAQKFEEKGIPVKGQTLIERINAIPTYQKLFYLLLLSALAGFVALMLFGAPILLVVAVMAAVPLALGILFGVGKALNAARKYIANNPLKIVFGLCVAAAILTFVFAPFLLPFLLPVFAFVVLASAIIKYGKQIIDFFKSIPARLNATWKRIKNNSGRIGFVVGVALFITLMSLLPFTWPIFIAAAIFSALVWLAAASKNVRMILGVAIAAIATFSVLLLSGLTGIALIAVSVVVAAVGGLIGAVIVAPLAWAWNKLFPDKQSKTKEVAEASEIELVELKSASEGAKVEGEMHQDLVEESEESKEVKENVEAKNAHERPTVVPVANPTPAPTLDLPPSPASSPVPAISQPEAKHQNAVLQRRPEEVVSERQEEKVVVVPPELKANLNENGIAAQSQDHKASPPASAPSPSPSPVPAPRNTPPAPVPLPSSLQAIAKEIKEIGEKNSDNPKQMALELHKRYMSSAPGEEKQAIIKAIRENKAVWGALKPTIQQAADQSGVPEIILSAFLKAAPTFLVERAIGKYGLPTWAKGPTMEKARRKKLPQEDIELVTYSSKQAPK